MFSADLLTAANKLEPLTAVGFPDEPKIFKPEFVTSVTVGLALSEDCDVKLMGTVFGV